MEEILSRLKLNDARKPTPPTDVKNQKSESGNLDKLLNNLQDQNKTLKKQEKELKNETDPDHTNNGNRSSTGIRTPATENFGHPKPAAQLPAPNKVDIAEMMRVKQELEAAKSVISRQEQELAETRTLKHTMDQAMGPPSEADFGAPNDITEQTIGHLQSAFNASARPFTSRNDAWVIPEGARLEQTDTLAAGNFGRGRGIWNNASASMTDLLATNAPAAGYPNLRDGRLSGQAYNGVYGAAVSPAEANFQPRNLSGGAGPVGYDMRSGNDMMQFNPSLGMRRNGGQLRINPNLADPLTQYGSFPPGSSALTPPPISPMGLAAQYPYQRGLATPITPAASEFTPGGVPGAANPWSIPVSNFHYPGGTVTNVLSGHWSQRSNLCHTSRANELSSSPRQVCFLRLEVYCRQDCL